MEQTPRQLLEANITLIRQLLRSTARRHRLTECERQDFESWIWLRLVDNDFHVIRRFQGRSSFATYLRVVLQRSMLDYRAAKWGKWRPSAHARRQGPRAVTLERLISRDGVPPEVAAARLNAGASELPPRQSGPRRRFYEPVELTVDILAPQETSPDERVLSAERRGTARTVTRALARCLAGIPRSDRRLLWLRYGAKLTVSQIAIRLGEDQRALYRKFVRLHQAVRRGLESSGITWAELAGVIGASDVAVQGAFIASETEQTSAQTTQRLALNASDRAWPLASWHRPPSSAVAQPTSASLLV